MRALRRAGFNPPWPTEVGPTTSHSCRLWALFHVKSGVAKFGSSDDSFCRICSLIAVAMGQKGDEKWISAVGLQPMYRKSDRQLACNTGAAEVIEMTLSDKPQSRLQKYRLTQAGQQWLELGWAVSQKTVGWSSFEWLT